MDGKSRLFRDEAICIAFSDGAKVKELAARHKLDRQQIKRILKRKGMAVPDERAAPVLSATIWDLEPSKRRLEIWKRARLAAHAARFQMRSSA